MNKLDYDKIKSNRLNCRTVKAVQSIHAVNFDIPPTAIGMALDNCANLTAPSDIYTRANADTLSGWLAWFFNLRLAKQCANFIHGFIPFRFDAQ